MNSFELRYMFHGGTNFGYSAGAITESSGEYHSCTTSYDYDAPLSEAGDVTDKFYAIRDVIGKYLPLPDIPIPTSAKMAIGPVAMKLWNTMDTTSKFSSINVNSIYPLTFAQLRQPDAYILYSTNISLDIDGSCLLSFQNTIHDRALIYVNEVK